MVEVAVGVRVVQFSMLAEILNIVSSLHHVQHLLVEIGSGKNLALIVEIQTPGISATFGKKFEGMRQGMIAPNTLLKLEAADLCRDGAALRAIQPAVRSPGKRIGK